MRARKTLGTAGLAVTLFGGVALSNAPSASAEAPCVSNNKACDGSDDPPPSKGELDCYKNGAWGGAPGLLTGDPWAALAGAAVGCVKGATGN